MFKKGDVLQNKYGNSPIRLLEETYHGKTGLMTVSSTGYVSASNCTEEHYYKISYWKWLRVTVPHILEWFYCIFSYQQDKNLGLVDSMDPDEYWRTHPHYKEKYILTSEYGYLSFPKKIKEVAYPVWREKNFYPHFEVQLGGWLLRRIKHILPTRCL